METSASHPGFCCNGDITNAIHTAGHNGKTKNLCLMRVRGNPNDTDYSNDKYRKTIDDPRFCSGHLQTLFNITW